MIEFYFDFFSKLTSMTTDAATATRIISSQNDTQLPRFAVQNGFKPFSKSNCVPWVLCRAHISKCNTKRRWKRERGSKTSQGCRSCQRNLQFDRKNRNAEEEASVG